MPTKKEWGQSTWFLLHTMAASFPTVEEYFTQKRIEDFILFVKYLFLNLPCGICANHATDYLEKHPLEEVFDDIKRMKDEDRSNDPLQLYFFNMHNDVNKRIEKYEGTPKHYPTFEEVKKAFDPSEVWKPFGGYPFPHSLADAATIKDENKILKTKIKAVEDENKKLSSASKTSSPTWLVVLQWVLISLAIIIGVAILIILGVMFVKKLVQRKKQLSQQ